MTEEPTNNNPLFDMKDLPWSAENPADGFAVSEELVALVAAIAGVVSVNPHMAADLLADKKKEPGQSIFIQQVRFALALQSLVDGSDLEIIEGVGPVITETIEASVEALEQAGYLHLHE